MHIDATINVATLGGTWRDSAGNSGAFVSTPGAGVGGSPRPSSQPGGLDGVSLGFGLSSTTGADDNVSLQVDVQQVKAGLDMRTPNALNLAIGLDALRTFDTTADSGYNTAFGNRALKSLTDGALNTAVGDGALAFTTRGSANTAVGVQALTNNTIGSSNVAIGDASMYLNSSGASNVGIGDFALERIRDGSRNVGIGCFALRSPNGSDNIAIGYQAGQALFPAALPSTTSSLAVRASSTTTTQSGLAGRGTSARSSPALSIRRRGAGCPSTSTQAEARHRHIVHSLQDGAGIGRGRRPPASPSQSAAVCLQAGVRRRVETGAVRPHRRRRRDHVSGAGRARRRGRPWTVRYHLLTPLLLADVQRLERERMALMEALAERDRTQALRIDELTREIAELRKETGHK